MRRYCNHWSRDAQGSAFCPRSEASLVLCHCAHSEPELEAFAKLYSSAGLSSVEADKHHVMTAPPLDVMAAYAVLPVGDTAAWVSSIQRRHQWPVSLSDQCFRRSTFPSRVITDSVDEVIPTVAYACVMCPTAAVEGHSVETCPSGFSALFCHSKLEFSM
jgi:hypothetical protein